jgi:ABC-type glutathione transport system ATPase component
MGYADVHPMELSVGEQRRLTCISQMVSPPDLLVVDEPTTGLDAVACDRILALLAEHAASGGAVLIITHDLRAARRVAGRIVALRAGRIVEDRPTEEFFSDPTALERAGLQRQGGSKPTPSGGDDV